MFNSVYKRCNSNDANAWRGTGSGELHATFFDSRPDGNHALPPTAQTVAQVVAQSVAPPMEQTVAYQRPGMVGTLGAGELPPEPECPYPATRSPTHQVRGGIDAPR